MYNGYSFVVDAPLLCLEDLSNQSGGIINFAMDNSKFSSMLMHKPHRKNKPRVPKHGRIAPSGLGGSTGSFGMSPRLTQGGSPLPQTPLMVEFSFVYHLGLDYHSQETVSLGWIGNPKRRSSPPCSKPSGSPTGRKFNIDLTNSNLLQRTLAMWSPCSVILCSSTSSASPTMTYPLEATLDEIRPTT